MVPISKLLLLFVAYETEKNMVKWKDETEKTFDSESMNSSREKKDHKDWNRK